MDGRVRRLFDRLNGELYRGKSRYGSVVVVQRPPMHRTLIANGREYHVLLPYTQSYVFFDKAGWLAKWKRFQFSMTKKPVRNMFDHVFCGPFYNGGCPEDGWCLGSFNPGIRKVNQVVRSTIAHFWQSDFVNQAHMSELQYLTKMGNTFEHIFDATSIAHNRGCNTFAACCMPVGKLKKEELKWQERKN